MQVNPPEPTSTAPPRHRGRLCLLGLVVLAVPIVPAVVWGEGYANWLLGRQPSGGALLLSGTALLAADILIPVPSGPLLVLLAARCGWLPATAAGVVGLTVGGLAGYALARWGGRPAAERWVGAEELARWERATAVNGDWLLLASRPLPVVAEATALAAGLGKMPLARYVFWLLTGSAATSACFALVGQIAAEQEGIAVGVAFSIAAPLVIYRVARIRHSDEAPLD